ncbi:MAG: gliding motility-associated C-terminal domain-containing protein [Saprospiraceae bacterium]|nr:gliding motility-associated C-terminal domain-containing protein [Saprospiraceae bacterium]
MRSFLTVTILLISTYFLSGQTSRHTHGHTHQHPDGHTHELTPEDYMIRPRNSPFCSKHQQPDRAQREWIAKQFRKWQNEVHAKSMAPIRTIPIVFHLLEYDPAITNAQVETAVASLNNAFSHSHNNPQGDDYSGGTRGVDTQIEFCLAQRAPDGGVTTGIVRWRSDYENMDVDLEDAKLKTQGQWDPRYYLNVWVVAHLDNETDQSYTGSSWWNRDNGLGGYSGGPGGVVGPDAKTDGVVVAGLGSALLAHEIGHYMSLAHTFTGGCKNDDCLVDGDGICDTPPDNSQAGCNQNTCDTDTLSNYSNGIFTTDVPDMTSNFMDYGSCPSEFTQGQADKMLFVMDNQRINLAVEPPSNNDACLKPCNADFSVEFAISERYPEPNVAIDFTSSILGTGIDSYEWYVEALGHPGFNYPVAWLKGFTPSTMPLSTGPNLQHTFLDPGKYRVYLKAWNSADPTCFASYARTVRVTCLGIDARFTPNVRLIASKQDRGKMLDSVLFSNRSVNATDFEWTVRHEPYDGMTPAQPDFVSNDTNLHHTFLEPGDYYITLIAKNGPNCTDTCGPFLLPVLDPTIDGRLKINRVDCYKEDSLRIAFEMFNDGFDTIRMGMPVTFYDEDPRNATPTPKILGTYFLDKIVYGKDNSENFVAILPSTRPELDQVWAVFNDLGTSSFPITWPTPDGNVMSVNSEFPTSGENELNYENNFAHKSKFQFEAFLTLPNSWDCTDTEIQLEASHKNGRTLAGIDWTPTDHLSCTNCLDPIFALQNTVVDQELILSSEYVCRDTVSVTVPALVQDIPVASVTNPPDICLGASPLDLTSFVGGTQITWYPTENATDGTATAPVMDTSTPGTYSLWVSDRVNGCEGPKVELRYTISTGIATPEIRAAPTLCAGETMPDLSTLVNGSNLLWYLSEIGGTGSPTPPSSDGTVPGTFTYWVSQSSGTCESPRVAVSYTISSPPGPPVITAPSDICVGAASPDLGSYVDGTNLTWYSSADVTSGSDTPPIVGTDISGNFEFWVSQTVNACEGPRTSISLSVLPISSPPTVTLSPPICANTTPPDLNSLVSGTNLLWYTDQIDSVGMATAPIIDASIPQTNTYWVSQNENTCESPRVAIELIVKPIPEAPSVTDVPNLCVGDPSLALQELVSGHDLRWYTYPDQDSTIVAPIIETLQGQRYDFWVSQTLTACESARLPITITVTDLVISPSGPHEIEEGEELELSVDIDIFPDDEGFFTIWSDGTGQIIETGKTNVLVYPEDNTLYTVQVDAGACSEVGNIPVEVIFQIDPTAIFSPNGDGRNDTWYIGDIGRYPESTLTVYNRWGATVYQAQAYQNDWDGRGRDGAELPLATYYYVVDLNQFGLKPVTGHVTIIR